MTSVYDSLGGDIVRCGDRGESAGCNLGSAELQVRHAQLLARSSLAQPVTAMRRAQVQEACSDPTQMIASATAAGQDPRAAICESRCAKLLDGLSDKCLASPGLSEWSSMISVCHGLSKDHRELYPPLLLPPPPPPPTPPTFRVVLMPVVVVSQTVLLHAACCCLLPTGHVVSFSPCSVLRVDPGAAECTSTAAQLQEVFHIECCGTNDCAAGPKAAQCSAQCAEAFLPYFSTCGKVRPRSPPSSTHSPPFRCRTPSTFRNVECEDSGGSTCWPARACSQQSSKYSTTVSTDLELGGTVCAD